MLLILISYLSEALAAFLTSFASPLSPLLPSQWRGETTLQMKSTTSEETGSN